MATSRFYTDQKTAHRLSNLKKRNVFYFRTITAFPSDRVYCETTATGYDFINVWIVWNSLWIKIWTFLFQPKKIGCPETPDIDTNFKQITITYPK